MKSNKIRKRRIIVFLLIAVFSITTVQFSYGQEKLLSLNDVMKDDPPLEGNRPRNGSISPDAQWIVFTWKNPAVDKEKDGLYKVRIDGGTPEEVMTPFRTRIRWEEELDHSLVMLEKRKVMLLDIETGSKTEFLEGSGIGMNYVYSPDKSKIAFSNKDGFWLINTDGTGKKILTAFSVNNFKWTGDSERIFYYKDSNIWYLTVKNRKVTKVTNEPEKVEEQPRGRFNRGGLGNYTLTNDGKYFTYTEFKSNIPDRNIVVPKYVGPKYVRAERARNSFPTDPYGETTVFLFDVEGQQKHELDLGDSKFRLRGMAWSEDGKKLYVSKLAADQLSFTQFMVDPVTCAASIIDSELDEEWIAGPGFASFWDKDYKNIIFTSERSGYNHIWRVSADGGEPEQLTFGDWELERVRYFRDKDLVVYQSAEVSTYERHIYSLELKNGKKKKITTKEGFNLIDEISRDGKYILYTHESTAYPNDYHVTELTDKPKDIKEVKVSFTVPADLENADLVQPEFVTFGSHVDDDVVIHARIYKPRDLDTSAKYPAVIFVHGAGYLHNTNKAWQSYQQNIKFHHRLTQKGYIVLDLDYRGSKGYGRDFRTDVYMYLGGKDLDDEISGVEYLKTLPYVDTEYLGLYGGSYGGFMTLMALFLQPDVFKAGAALRSVTDWVNYNQGYTQARLGIVKENKEAYKKSSPIHFAENLKGHLLLMHGLIDSNVFAQDSFQLVEKLIKAGKTDLFESVFYPTQNHGFTDPDSWIDEYRRIELLFDRYLRVPMGLPVIDDKN
ncbi:MAG: S9 family peptidase [bacterium]|nr:S9 family peptidase [bacterium]